MARMGNQPAEIVPARTQTPQWPAQSREISPWFTESTAAPSGPGESRLRSTARALPSAAAQGLQGSWCSMTMTDRQSELGAQKGLCCPVSPSPYL